MSDVTPKKQFYRTDNCFSCERKRYFSFTGNKSESIIQKLSVLCNIDSTFIEEKGKALGLCRPCLNKIDTTYEFLFNIQDKLREGLEAPETFKRVTNSTPRKCLKKARSADTSDSTQLTDPELTTGSCIDHQYCVNPSTAPVVQDTCTNFQLDDPLVVLQSCLSNALQHTPLGAVSDFVDKVFENEVVLKAIKKRLLQDVDTACSSLVSKNAAFGSVLSRHRGVEHLMTNGHQLCSEIVQEMHQRVPFVLDMFTVMSTAGREPSRCKVAPITSSYAILMNTRNEHLSAWHRQTTFVAIKGNLDDVALTRFNQLGLTQSPTSKLRLLDEAGSNMKAAMSFQLKRNFLLKVTGDNLDMYIKTGHQSLERSNKDIHLFASNVIFSRIAKPGLYSLAQPICQLERLTPERFLPSGHFREILKNSYCVLLGRILSEMKAFAWLRPVVPDHVYHPYHHEMAQKSVVLQLPIMLKNETKHEDCVDILDEYENVLSDIFQQAFGSDELLRKFKAPIGGDQLTRVRLSEAKNLRSLATTPKKRFEDLHPIVIELWHVKQDYLEKCYKALYNPSSLRQPGTLYHYKSKLQQNNVNGNVKGAFKSHHDFLLLVGKKAIEEQFLEFFAMEDENSDPTANVPTMFQSRAEREKEMYSLLDKFMTCFGYLDDGHETGDLLCSDTQDTVYNYQSNLCHWVLQLMLMEDIVQEGDIVRLIPSLMYTLQFFYSHSHRSKYFEECLDFILKTEFLLSPMDRIRVLEGAFTNLRGGISNNMESDLVQENSVSNQKDLIRSLGANKTDKAIFRCTSAADTVVQICDKLDEALTIKKKGSKHHVPDAPQDEKLVRDSLRALRPFSKTMGRSCKGFHNIQRSPLLKIDISDFKNRIWQVVPRLFYGHTTPVADNAVDDEE